MSNIELQKERFKEYLEIIQKEKAKLDPEDFFILGMAVGSQSNRSFVLTEKIKSYEDQNKVIKTVPLSKEQMIDYRFAMFTRLRGNSQSSQDSQSQPQLNSREQNGSNKKRSFSEMERQQMAEPSSGGGEKKKPVLMKISEADIEDDSDSIPEYAFDAKATSNIREFYQPSSYKKQYGNNGHSNNHNANGGLGFVEDDLNLAIESLVGDNTQFRSSLQPNSDMNNELSQELPIANNDRSYTDADADMLQETQIQKEFSFNNPPTFGKQRNSNNKLTFQQSRDILVDHDNSLNDLLYNKSREDEHSDEDFKIAMKIQNEINGNLSNNRNKQHNCGEELDEETKNMIEQLQNEDKMEMERLRKAREQQVDEEFICQVCYDGFNEENIFPLTQCIHVFHNECLHMYLKGEISESRFPLRCPENKCDNDLCIQDLNKLLTKEELEKYDRLTFNQVVDKQGDLSWCPTANCDFAFIYEEGEDTELECPKCKKHYCLNCRVLFHKDQTCKEYQISHTKDKNDEAFMKFAKGAKLKQCPFCQHWVQKTEGCDHMRCRCGKDFCYKCGGIYMKCECQKKMQAQQQQRIERMRRLREQAQERRRKRQQEEKARKAREKQQEKDAKNAQRGQRYAKRAGINLGF